MSESNEEIYRFVCKMRDDYAKVLRAKKKLHYPYCCGMCLYIIAKEVSYTFRKNTLYWIAKWANFTPTNAYWFPEGQLKKRVDLMNKAIKAYEESKNKI